MRVLLDTDVILDFLLERRPFFEAASELLELNARNVRDYKNATLPVFTPTEFLSYIKSQQT